MFRVAFRRVLQQLILPPDGVLVVSRESFREYYGPFADCAVFSAAATFNPNYADIQHLVQQLPHHFDETAANKILNMWAQGPFSKCH